MAQAVAEYSTWLVYSNWEPRLDPPRSDPRFKNLLHRIASNLALALGGSSFLFGETLEADPRFGPPCHISAVVPGSRANLTLPIREGLPTNRPGVLAIHILTQYA
jgi:hypothetical protein